MEKINTIYKILYKEYNARGWWPINGKYEKLYTLNEEDKFEIAIGAILTQNTSWNNVEKALESLRKNNLLNKEKLKKINEKELALLIKSSGYNNQKAKKIKEYIKFLDSGNEITRENLLSIWGIGNETADSILLYAYCQAVFVIDAYTKRIFSRIGICRENIKYEELQELFHKNLENKHELFNEYHALIVEHAKRFCKTKPECTNCPLNKMCDYYKASKI